MRTMQVTLRSKHRQQGVALFIGLIFLVVLTLLGITAMQATTMEERMSGNSKDINTAFQAAEAALRDGEQDVNNSISPASGFNASCTSGLCTPSATATPVWQSITWSGTAPRTYGSNTGNPQLAGVSSQPKYIVEFMGWGSTTSAGKSLSTGKTPPVDTGTIYRITAMGWGGQSATQVMLQSVIKK